MSGFEMKVDREVLKGIVSHKITCEISGEVLNMRTAVAITVKRTGRPPVIAAYTGEVYDEKVAPNIPALQSIPADVEILDGRKLWRK